MINKILEFISGSASNSLEGIANIADRFIHTKEDKDKFKIECKQLEFEVKKSQQSYEIRLQELLQKREAEIEKTIRAETDAKTKIMLAESNNSDKYTKRARPTILYMGLVFIFIEVLGLRLILLTSLGAGNEIMTYSNEIFKYFLMTWGSIASIYTIGRTAEKRGSNNAVVKAITTTPVAKIAKTLKNKIRW